MGISEYQLINKVLDTKNYNIVLDNYITSEDFDQASREFAYIDAFYREYNCIPDKETFTSKFPEFEYFTVEQSDVSIVDDIKEKTLFKRAVKIINKSSEIFTRDANEGAKYLLNHIDELRPQSRFACTDVIAHADEQYKAYEKRVNNQDNEYVDMPFKEIQEDMFGFKRGEELFLFVAKSSTGKSQVLCCCIGCAKEQGLRVGVISPEMSKEALFMRIASYDEHFDNMALQRGLPVKGYKEYTERLVNSGNHVFIADRKSFNGKDITMGAIKEFIEKMKLDILFIDGIKYIRPSCDTRGMSEAKVLGEVCADLLNFSELYSIPIVGVAQARRRNNENKGDGDDYLDSESVYDSYQITQNCSRMITLWKKGNALNFHIAKNRYGIDNKTYVYTYDYNHMYFNYIPQLDDLCSTEEQKAEIEETKESFKNVL